MVEGGASILNSFIEAGLWDEANIEVSPVNITVGVKAPVLNLQPVSRDSFEGHEWLFYKK
jgi:diaminohydroxyphosphoribosylaminopyrimidine deaminase/5-amino-6-(5-phosphoribosylamino)uracil reductase